MPSCNEIPWSSFARPLWSPAALWPTAFMPRTGGPCPPIVFTPPAPCPQPPAQPTGDVLPLPTAPPRAVNILPVTQEPAATLPPAGTFPAIVRYLDVPDGNRVILKFEMAWKPHEILRFQRRINPRSDKGRKFLAVVRRAIGLSDSDDDSALDGKQISLAGGPGYVGGRLTWEAKRFLKPALPSERRGVEPRVEPDTFDALAERMIASLPDATFARDGDTVSMLRPGKPSIPVDAKSPDYAELQHRHTGLGTAESRGKVLAQRILFKAMERADRLRHVQFSFADQNEVIVPMAGGKVLRITGEGLDIVDNGCSGIWLEHPRGNPVEWDTGADARAGLAKFEELFVQTQAIPREPLRFLLGVVLGLFLFVRQRVKTRPILELIGQSGQGKTAATERFLQFYHLGMVQGDYSLARVKRDGDVGLIVRDNVETANLTRYLEDFFIFGATGAEWGRVGAGRAKEQPIIAVTTIEGIAKRSEIGRRLIRFEFQRKVTPSWSEGKILAEIDLHRAAMFRGIAEILRCTMAQNPPPVPPFIPMADSVDYCLLAYRLLRAWQDVAGKPAGFADAVFDAWAAEQRSDEAEDSAGPYPRLLEELIARRQVCTGDPCFDTIEIVTDYTCKEARGRLYIATPTAWLTALKAVASTERDLVLPARPEGLRRRLEELKPSHGYILVTEHDDKATLARRRARRLWGILDIAPSGE